MCLSMRSREESRKERRQSHGREAKRGETVGTGRESDDIIVGLGHESEGSLGASQPG